MKFGRVYIDETSRDRDAEAYEEKEVNHREIPQLISS